MKLPPPISSGTTAELLLFFWLFPQYFKSDTKIKIIDNILGLVMPYMGYREVSNLMLS